jgi:hypothetical protein
MIIVLIIALLITAILLAIGVDSQEGTGDGRP